MKKVVLSLLLCLTVLFCAMNYGTFAVTENQTAADGTYTAAGEVDFWADTYTFELTLVVKDGAVSTISQVFTSAPYEEDSEDYYHPRALNSLIGKLRGKPATVSALDEYAADAVSGATYSFHALRSAVKKALESASASTNGGAVTKYTVTYDLNGAPAEAPEPQLFAPGESVTVIADPIWAAHIFDGWSGAEIANGKFVMPAENVTLTVQWINQISAAPGEPTSAIVESGKYAVGIDYSGAGLDKEKVYRSFCAQYDSSGRMLQVKSNAVTFDSTFQTYEEIENPRAGWTYKFFLLDSTSYIPQCQSVQLLFTARTPDGTYAGSAQCLTGYMNYMVDVDVTVKDGIITEITDRTLSTPMSTTDKTYYARAWDGIHDSISSGQFSADDYQDIDAVSGATISSKGINAAIADALSSQTAAADGEVQGDVYAPEGISLYARVYPIVTVADGKITDIRIVPVRDTNAELLAVFAEEIIRKQSVEGLFWPDEIQDDAYAVASLIDQILYGKGVLK